MRWVSRIYFAVLVTSLACALFLGGSTSEAPKALSALYLISSIVLVLVFAFRPIAWMTKSHAVLLTLAGGLAGWLVIQSLPIWTDLIANADRDLASAGLAVLQQPDEIRTISLFPEKVWTTLVAFSLPLAVFTLIASLPKKIEMRALIWVIPMFGAASSVLGLAQIIGGVAPELYLYENTNMGSAVGAFANANHQSCFLLMTLPFAVMASAQAARGWKQSDLNLAFAIFYAAISMVIIVGILASGSIAGYVLLVGVAICFGLKYLAKRLSILKVSMLFGGPVVVIAALAALFLSDPLLAGLGETPFEAGNDSRIGMNLTGLEIWQQHWLLGTGPGTVAQVFPLYENSETVGSTFVNHLHNDYLEWAIETGLPGALIVFSVFLWIVRRTFSLAFSSKAYPGVQFAALIAIWVPILYSSVDYSFRNPAIIAFAALMLAIIAVEFGKKGRTNATVAGN